MKHLECEYPDEIWPVEPVRKMTSDLKQIQCGLDHKANRARANGRPHRGTTLIIVFGTCLDLFSQRTYDSMYICFLMPNVLFRQDQIKWCRIRSSLCKIERYEPKACQIHLKVRILYLSRPGQTCPDWDLNADLATGPIRGLTKCK